MTTKECGFGIALWPFWFVAVLDVIRGGPLTICSPHSLPVGFVVFLARSPGEWRRVSSSRTRVHILELELGLRLEVWYGSVWLKALSLHVWRNNPGVCLGEWVLGGWLFFLHTISQDWEGLSSPNLAQNGISYTVGQGWWAPSARHPLILRNQGLGAGASRSVSVYFPAEAGPHFADSGGDGRLSGVTETIMRSLQQLLSPNDFSLSLYNIST